MQTNSQRTLLVWAAVLCVIAVAIASARLFFDVRLNGPHFAKDGSFAVSSLMQFEAELRHGVLSPKWTFEGNFRIGSPIFFFYPPGAYYLASLVSTLTLAPDATEYSTLSLTAVLLTLVTIAISTAWLKSRIGLNRALFVGALYCLMPYVSFFNPQIRLAFAEMCAVPLWPLAFWALEAARERPLATVVMSSPVFALFWLTHIPSVILCSGVLWLHATTMQNTWKLRVRSVLLIGFSIMLGGAMAGFYLVPAIGLQYAIPTRYLDSGFTSSLLKPTSFIGIAGKLQNLSLLIPLAAVVWLAWEKGRVAWRNPYLLTLLATTVLVSPLAEPLWLAFPPLHRVQFPWRLLTPISLLSAILIVSLSRELGRARLYLLLGGFLLMGIGMLLLTVLVADRTGDTRSRNQTALDWWNSQPPEYTPLPAADSGWLEQRSGGKQFTGHYYTTYAGRLASPCVGAPELMSSSVAFSLSACSAGVVHLPIFSFPGWSATIDGQATSVDTDSHGLLTVTALADAHRLVLRRETLPMQVQGLMLSGIGIVAWLALLFRFVQRRGATVTAPLSMVDA